MSETMLIPDLGENATFGDLKEWLDTTDYRNPAWSHVDALVLRLDEAEAEDCMPLEEF